MKLLRDTSLIFNRQMQLLLRHPALQVQTNAEAYEIFVPGLLVLLAIFGGLFQGFGLIAELRAGVIERSRVTPVSRLALLLGRSLRDVVSLLVQCLIITLLSIPFGLKVQLGNVLLAYLLLGLIALMLSALSYGIALKLRSEDALAPLLNTVGQPILLLSGILLPMDHA